MQGNTKAIGTALGAMILLSITFFAVQKNVLTLVRNDSSDEIVETSKTESNTHYVYGDRIFDEDDNEVLWRGAGGSYLFHTEDKYQEAWRRHMPDIQAMGFNIIRLAFAFADSTPNPEYDSPSADILCFEKMDWVLDLLDHYDVKGILDLHNWADMHGDFGSQKLINNWLTVAQYYRDDPRIVAYELFNEPYSYTWASSVQSKTDVALAYRELTEAIREIDPDHIVIWQSEPYVPPLGEIEDYLPSNVVFTAHRWWTNRQWEFDIWTAEHISYKTVDRLVKWREQLKRPFWLGEFGGSGGGSSYESYNLTDLHWEICRELLYRTEEQVFSWNLWMGRTAMDVSWNGCLRLFPLKIFNHNLEREAWVMPIPYLRDYVTSKQGVDVLQPFHIELWQFNDSVTFKPGIILSVITEQRLPSEISEIISKQEMAVTETLTVCNLYQASDDHESWSVKIYSTGFLS